VRLASSKPGFSFEVKNLAYEIDKPLRPLKLIGLLRVVGQTDMVILSTAGIATSR
jgi:hypothetical protein